MDLNRGAPGSVEHRLAWAKVVKKRTIDEHEESWARTIQLIQDDKKYGNLKLEPQVGLIPLGRNPQSKLFEFYFPRSAELAGPNAPIDLPYRDPETGAYDIAPDTGIIFVLIPGGEVTLGSERMDQASPFYDPYAELNETPLVRSNLAAFFLSKYELTQAQMMRLGSCENPSFHYPGKLKGMYEKEVSLTNPVEQVSWNQASHLLWQHGLTLPTEPQWEHACRANTTDPWCVAPPRSRCSARSPGGLATNTSATNTWDGVHGSTWPMAGTCGATKILCPSIAERRTTGRSTSTTTTTRPG